MYKSQLKKMDTYVLLSSITYINMYINENNKSVCQPSIVFLQGYIFSVLAIEIIFDLSYGYEIAGWIACD